MIGYLVTERPLGATLLRALLPEALLERVGIVAAADLADAKSLGRSLLAARRVPVAIVADAGSVSAAMIQERREGIEELLVMVDRRLPTRAILAVPELEGVFFEAVDWLGEVLGIGVSSEELIVAKFQPRLVLEGLIGRSPKVETIAQFFEQAIAGFNSDQGTACSQSPIVQEAAEFLRRVHALQPPESSPNLVLLP